MEEVHAETISQLDKEKEEFNNILHKESELCRVQTEYEVNEYWKSLIKEKIEERKLWLSSNDIGYKDDYVLEVLEELLNGKT